MRAYLDKTISSTADRYSVVFSFSHVCLFGRWTVACSGRAAKNSCWPDNVSPQSRRDDVKLGVETHKAYYSHDIHHCIP